MQNAKETLLNNRINNPFIMIKTNNTEITIQDNAGGIADNIIENIFDPYFSTKTEKNGTGLGLYMSKTIIENHCKGQIYVSNKEDGALFKIIFPK